MERIEIGKNSKKSILGKKCSDKDFSPIWANRNIPIQLFEFVQKATSSQFKKVVDIGCGLGEIAQSFSIKGYDSYGFDISPTAIDKAKEDNTTESKRNFFVHDITDASLDNKFDILIDRGCFHGIPEDLKNYALNLANSSNDGAVFFLLFADLEVI